jgi:hypothetical protein
MSTDCMCDQSPSTHKKSSVLFSTHAATLLASTTARATYNRMPKKTTYTGHWENPETAPTCEAQGCPEKGVYKAPKTVGTRKDFYWFCIEHVRAYNQAWDYFRGMPTDEIESFMRDAVTGHRPTWRIGDQPFLSKAKLEEKLRQFMGEGRNSYRQKKKHELSGKERDALRLFELELPVDEAGIKKQYKKLVKRYHPDVNKGSKRAEETFKEITLAYTTLLKRFGTETDEKR